jgi:VanZ family protein
VNTERLVREFPWLRPSAKYLPPRAFGWLVLGVAIFIVYGSLVPFKFRWRPFDDAVHGFQWVLEHRTGIQSRSDFLANFALGLPLGFAVAAWRLLDRAPSIARRLAVGLVAWPACTLFAASVEFSQLYFPNRTCSGSDILAQSLGAAVGLLAYLFAGQRVVDQLRARLGPQSKAGPALGWLAVLATAVALAQWLPLDISASPADWYRKLKDGTATLSPFSELGIRPEVPMWRKGQVWLELAGLYLTVGLVLAFAPFGRPVRLEGLPPWMPVARVALRVFGLGLAFATILEASQFPVMSRSPSVTDILIGGTAVFLGWLIAYGMGVNATGGGLDIEAALILGQAWLLWLAIVAWLPFEFDGTIGGARFRDLNWLPFAAAQEKNYLGGLEEAVSKTILALPYGAIVAALGPAARANRRQRIALGAALAGGLALVLEAGQLYLPERVASPSDVIYAAVGGAIGAAVTLRLRSIEEASRETTSLEVTPPPMAKLQVDDPSKVIR